MLYSANYFTRFVIRWLNANIIRVDDYVGLLNGFKKKYTEKTFKKTGSPVIGGKNPNTKDTMDTKG